MEGGTTHVADKPVTPQDEAEVSRSDREVRNGFDGTRGGIISFLFDELVSLLETILQDVGQGDAAWPWYETLEKGAAALLFWGMDHSVSRGDLDATLQNSGLLRDTVLLILISISNLVIKSIVHLMPTAKARMTLLKNTNILALVEKAEFAVAEPYELDTHHEMICDENEACDILQSRIRCLTTLNASLGCPAESDSDEEEPRVGQIYKHYQGHSHFRGPIAAGSHIPEHTKSGFRDSAVGSSSSVYGSDQTRTQSVYAATTFSSRAEARHERIPSLVKEAKETQTPPPIAWTAKDDEILIRARARGLNWNQIAPKHFPQKSSNTCRKRHELLIERQNADEWDGVKLDVLAQAYFDARREMWCIMAARLGEKWTLIEQKCMEKGLKNLTSAYRMAERKSN